MHHLHCVRRLLIRSRINMRPFLMCALLLGSQFGLAMDLASAQGTKALSVNWVQPGDCPQPLTDCQNNHPNVPPGVPPVGVPPSKPLTPNLPRLPMTGACPLAVASDC